MRLFKNVRQTLLFLSMCTGCQALKNYDKSRLDKINNRNVELAEGRADFISGQIEKDFLNFTGWLKPPTATKDCTHDSDLNFKKVTVSAVHVRAASNISTSISLELNDEKSETVNVITLSGEDALEAVRECFFDYDPKAKYKMSKKDWSLISDGKYRIGFTQDQFLMSRGNPERIKKMETERGLTEQWEYGDGGLFYFKNGKLVVAQPST